MRSGSSGIAAALATFAMCAVCWWLWAADHGLAWRFGLAELDLPVRVLAIFVFLSVADRLIAASAGK
jgi:hypothetical protein